MARAEHLIGLEVTYKKIRLVELVTLPAGIEVTNFALMDLPPEGLKVAGPKLQSLLKEKHFLGKKVNALLSYPSIDYLQVTLPPISKSDLKLAAIREAKKDIKLPEGELIFAYDHVGESEEKGLPKKEVLIARSNAKDVREYLHVLKEADLQFNSLTVIPAVLLNLFRMRGVLKEETLAGILVGEEKGTIVILHQGNFRFPRDFPLRLTGEAGGLQARLIAELKRSLLYLKQRVRGLEPQKIVLMGDIDKPQEVTAAITQEVGIQTEIYIPPGIDLSPLGDRMEEFRNSLPQFTIPMGLAWNGPERLELNLLAEKVQALKRAHWAKLAVVGTAALLIILLVLRFAWLWVDGRPYWKNLKKAKEELAVLQPKVKEIATTREERDRQKLRLAFLGKIKGPKTGWEKILRAISLIIPQEMHLELLELKETPEDWSLRLWGQVVGANASVINKRFNEFFSLFLTSPDLIEGRVESLKILPMAKKEVPLPGSKADESSKGKKAGSTESAAGTPYSLLEFAVVVKVK